MKTNKQIREALAVVLPIAWDGFGMHAGEREAYEAAIRIGICPDLLPDQPSFSGDNLDEVALAISTLEGVYKKGIHKK